MRGDLPARTGGLTLNADMGESVGIHSFGNDDELLGIVDSVNVACGMHAGDPGAMGRVVQRAQEAGVTIGAHPGLPDMTGFGRREMSMDATEVRDLVRYQVGALVGFLDACGAALDHIKPHGALFGMVGRDPALMDALCDVAVQYAVPVYGLAGTAHESVARRRGVPFVAEYYVDLDYADDGSIIVRRLPVASDLGVVEERARRMRRDGTTVTVSGRSIPVRVESVCIHSDLPNAVDVARVVRTVLAEEHTGR